MKHASIFVVVFVVVASLFVASHGAAYGEVLKSYTPQTTGGTVITFEGRTESELIQNQYPGVTFSQFGGATYPGKPDSTPSRPQIDNYVDSESGWKFGYGASSGSAVLTGSTEGGFPFETVAGIRATFSSPVSSVELFFSDTAPLGNYT
ncbi:MAG: hypothetical protein DMF98_24690, partial [Acidobacteria bacterium]